MSKALFVLKLNFSAKLFTRGYPDMYRQSLTQFIIKSTDLIRAVCLYDKLVKPGFSFTPPSTEWAAAKCMKGGPTA